MPELPRFFIDVGSPYAWLAAERIEGLLGEVVWEPVLLGAMFRARGWGSWSGTDVREEGMREVERRAAAYGVGPVHWPEHWPGDMLLAMRIAVAADAIGRGRAFLMTALRATFGFGADLSDPATVADVAFAVGIMSDVQELAADPAIKEGLRMSTERAIALGVQGVPTVLVGDQVFWGDDRLDEAAAAAR